MDCFGTKPAYQVHHVDEDDDGREHSRPRILGVTQDKACHAVLCGRGQGRLAFLPDRDCDAEFRSTTEPIRCRTRAERQIGTRGFLPTRKETMRTVSDSASVLSMTL